MKFFLSLGLICLGTLSVPADAGTVGGKIVHVASINNVILFRVSGGTDSNRPACATSLRYAIDKDSVHAPLVLTAFATGKTLGTLSGLGTCSLFGNSEDLQFIEVCPLAGCS